MPSLFQNKYWSCHCWSQFKFSCNLRLNVYRLHGHERCGKCTICNENLLYLVNKISRSSDNDNVLFQNALIIIFAYHSYVCGLFKKWSAIAENVFLQNMKYPIIFYSTNILYQKAFQTRKTSTELFMSEAKCTVSLDSANATESLCLTESFPLPSSESLDRINVQRLQTPFAALNQCAGYNE